MKKTTKQILKKVAKYSAVYGLGVATVVAVWWATYVPPEKRRLISSQYLSVFDTGIEQVPTYKLERMLFSGQAYLYEPVYFLQRQKGEQVLEKAAALGSLDAMGILLMYHSRQANAEKPLSSRWMRHANKVRSLSMDMANAGDPMGIWTALPLLTSPLTQEELMLMESYGKNYKKVARILAYYYGGAYFEGIRDAEKEAEWEAYIENHNDFLDEPEMPILRQYSYQRAK